MKRVVNLLIILFGIIFLYIVITGTISFKCVFKELLGISCPGCGLTRSFRAIINLDFNGAIKYNILGIPLFVSIILVGISLVIDIILNSDRTLKFIDRLFKKNYIVIILILIITLIINNINGI